MSEKVYLVGQSKDKVSAYTYDKCIAKMYKKQRKGYVVKTNIKNVPKSLLEDSYTYELTVAYNYALTDAEFEYFSEAWIQWSNDAIRDIEDFIEEISLFKFSKKERALIAPLVKTLLGFRHDVIHDIVGDVEQYDEYYNYENVMKFFIERILQ